MLMLSRRKGFILIFTLWVLGVLTVLAVGLAAGIRQKIVLLEKLDQRSRTKYLLEAAVKFSSLYIAHQLNLSENLYSPTVKANLHNNPNAFSRFELANDYATISYQTLAGMEIFGIEDEERKINLNTTTTTVLSRLLERVLFLKPEAAVVVASDILDWRQYGKGQAIGFYSDEYYDNLKYPYAKKDANYDSMDELLLVKGVTKEIYNTLIHYVTIYGQGQVNINTAPAEVLYALGLEDPLIEKILQVRQGEDKLEASGDDHAFLKTFDIASEIKAVLKLDPSEIRAIDSLNQQNLLTTNSYYFSLEAQAHLAHKHFSKRVRAIFSLKENRIIYWKER